MFSSVFYLKLKDKHCFLGDLIVSIAQPQKGRQNSNLNENFHSRIENLGHIWMMRIFDSKIKFFSEKELPLKGVSTHSKCFIGKYTTFH